MLQTLKLNSKKQKNFAFPKKKSFIRSTPGLNFINILRTVFGAKVLFAAFQYLQSFVFFWQTTTGKQAACKMLVK